jgi:hypothetical protein
MLIHILWQFSLHLKFKVYEVHLLHLKLEVYEVHSLHLKFIKSIHCNLAFFALSIGMHKKTP